MKRAIVSAMMILLLISFAAAKPSVTPITVDDLPYLQGEWTGASLRGQRINLRIHNDYLPIEGEIEVHFPGRESETCSFNDGQIEDGQLIISCDELVLSLYLRFQGDNLAGEIEFLGASGKIGFEKAY